MVKRCLICGEEFKNGAGLASHRRAKHPDMKGANRRAAEEMLAELERAGKLRDIDVARVQIIRSMADQLDADPSNANMWRTYSDAINELRGLDADSDPIEKIIQEIQSAAPLGHKKKD